MKSPVPLREIFEVPPRWRRLWSRMRISPRCPVGFLVWKPERRCPRWVFQAYQVKLVGWYIPIFIIYILVDMSCMDDIPSRCRLGDGNHPVIGFFLIQCIYIYVCVCLGIANTRWMIMLAIGTGIYANMKWMIMNHIPCFDPGTCECDGDLLGMTWGTNKKSGLKDCKWHLCPSLLSELV